MKRLLPIVFICFLCVFVSLSADGLAKVRVILNGVQETASDTIFIKRGDTLLMECDDKGAWIEHKPVLRRYTNVKGNISPRINYYEEIEYTSAEISSGKGLDVSAYITPSGPGTYYFSRAKSSAVYRSLTTAVPLHKSAPGIIQVVMRNDNTYTGYLQELFRTPFIWTPKMIKTMYQCDERVGSDCISFVIYGRRRMGHDVRYCPLDKVKRYLNQVTPDSICLSRINGKEVYTIDGVPVKLEKYSIKKGTFLHFEHHAAIFCEDRGLPGILDREDLAFQSIGVTPGITPLSSTDYTLHPLGIYEWKE